MMRYGIKVALLMLVIGCSSRPTPQEVLLRSDGRTLVDGVSATDRQLCGWVIAKCRKQGSFPVIIRADADVPLWRLAQVADIFHASGVLNIDTGRAQPEARALLYPTFHTWTNEWKWEVFFAGSNSIAAIKTNAGVNVRLLSDGARIEDSSATLPEMLDYLASLAGSGRARVVITAETNAPYSSLMAVLETCEKYAIDPLLVEHWETRQSPVSMRPRMTSKKNAQD